jgi:protein gp37
MPSGHSAIEWTEATWNPVTGCTRVSPGCARCYIERQPPFRIEGRRFRRVGNEETTGVRLHPERLEQPRRWRAPRVIFVNSMSDLFHDAISAEYIAAVFAVMAECEQHVFQVLTKRHERLRELAPDLPWPRNVWMGVSVENNRWAVRADYLRDVPAAVRFVSAEPLLGPVDRLELKNLHWVIVGGESGPSYRAMQADWARELRDRCVRAEVAFFFKQWGGRTPKSGGRLLDGQVWSEMPVVPALAAA